MPSAADYIEDLEATGRFVFTTQDATLALGSSMNRISIAPIS